MYNYLIVTKICKETLPPVVTIKFFLELISIAITKPTITIQVDERTFNEAKVGDDIKINLTISRVGEPVSVDPS